MPDRLDAHIHLFKGGYQGDGALTARPGVRVDEVALYADLARTFGITDALVIGYEGEPWATGNNAFIARQAGRHAWMKPLAYLTPADLDQPARLRRLTRPPFVGVAFYVFEEITAAAIKNHDGRLWQMVSDHQLLVSVNSQGVHWNCWAAVLEKFPSMRVLISHLGGQRPVAATPSKRQVERELHAVTRLAQYRNVHVKLSGLYACTQPAHAYPHAAAGAYVDRLLQAFGPRRVVWGSDFSPCLGSLSFQQAVDATGMLPAHAGRQAMGSNLRRLLNDVEAGRRQEVRRS